MTDPTSLPSFPSAPDEHALRSKVLDAMIGQGLAPRVDEDGDVAISMQDQSLFVRCLETEPPMVRAFGQWLLDDSIAGDELTRLRASNAVTSALNLVKVTINADRLAVSIDLIVSDGMDLGPLLGATLEAVLGSVRTWHETVTKLLEGADPSPA